MYSDTCEYVFKVKAESLLLPDGDCKTASVGYLLAVWGAGCSALQVGSQTHGRGGWGEAGRAGPQLAPRILLKYIFCTETQKKCSVHFSNNADVAEIQPPWNVPPTSGDRHASLSHECADLWRPGGGGESKEGEGEEYAYQRPQRQTSPPCSLLTGPARRRTHQQ